VGIGTLDRGAARVSSTFEGQHSQLSRRVAQVGLVARIAIYLVVASLCFELAAGSPTAQADTEGAFQEIHHQSGGSALLVLLACCMAAYALWRFHQAAVGSTRGRRGAWPRVGSACIGVLYSVLLANVVSVLVSGASSSGGQRPQPFVGTVLRWPAGSWLLGAAALALGLGGVVFVIWGFARDLSKVLQRERMSPVGWRAARVTSGLGDAGRGAVACLLAGALFSAAVEDRPSAARSVGQSLASLRHLGVGPEVICAIGVAFVAYGVFSMIELVRGRL